MQKRSVVASTFAAMMLVVGSASADDTIQYDPAQLADGKLPGTSVIFKNPGALGATKPTLTNGSDCKLVATPGAIEKDTSSAPKSGCDALWRKPELTTDVDIVVQDNATFGNHKLTFKAKPVSRIEAADWYELKGEVLTFKSKVPQKSVAVFRIQEADKQWTWKKVPVSTNKNLKIPPGLIKDAASSVTVYTNFDNTGANKWVWFDLALPGTDGGAGGDPAAANKDDDNKDGDKTKTSAPEPKHEGFCDGVEDAENTRYTVCLDLFADVDDDTADGTGAAFVFKPETRGHILLPNRAIVVRVRHARGGKVTISMDGKRGLSKGIIDDQARKKKDEHIEGEGLVTPQEPRSPDVVTEWSFGPRLPGQTDIKVVVEKDGKTSTYRTEATVEELLIGAFRLGLGPVFKGAVEQSYEAKVMPGSQQTQIVGKTSGYTDLELVLGFAPYVFDYYTRGGRAPISRRTSYIAPYFGLGLVNANENAFELLKSFHIGAELELSPGFSIAGTFVLRRVTRLASGYEVGMPVNDTNVPTTTGYNWGLGLIANFSPDFFKIATSSSSSFFK